MNQLATLPELKPSVKAENQQLLDYVRDLLCKNTNSGQCILHLNPGGAIRRIEWRNAEDSDDIIERLNSIERSPPS